MKTKSYADCQWYLKNMLLKITKWRKSEKEMEEKNNYTEKIKSPANHKTQLLISLYITSLVSGTNRFL